MVNAWDPTTSGGSSRIELEANLGYMGGGGHIQTTLQNPRNFSKIIHTLRRLPDSPVLGLSVYGSILVMIFQQAWSLHYLSGGDHKKGIFSLSLKYLFHGLLASFKIITVFTTRAQTQSIILNATAKGYHGLELLCRHSQTPLIWHADTYFIQWYSRHKDVYMWVDILGIDTQCKCTHMSQVYN